MGLMDFFRRKKKEEEGWEEVQEEPEAPKEECEDGSDNNCR